MAPSAGCPGPPPTALASWPHWCATSMLQGSRSRTCSSTGPASTMSFLRSPVTRPNGRQPLSLAAAGRGGLADGRRPDRHHAGNALPADHGATGLCLGVPRRDGAGQAQRAAYIASSRADRLRRHPAGHVRAPLPLCLRGRHPGPWRAVRQLPHARDLRPDRRLRRRHHRHRPRRRHAPGPDRSLSVAADVVVCGRERAHRGRPGAQWVHGCHHADRRLSRWIPAAGHDLRVHARDPRPDGDQLRFLLDLGLHRARRAQCRGGAVRRIHLDVSADLRVECVRTGLDDAELATALRRAQPGDGAVGRVAGSLPRESGAHDFRHPMGPDSVGGLDRGDPRRLHPPGRDQVPQLDVSLASTRSKALHLLIPMRREKLGILLALTAVLVTACGGASGGGTPTTGAAIVFGAAVSLTGAQSKEGNLTKQGYDLWLDWINQRGGIVVNGVKHPVQIKYEDDQSTPNLSATLVQKLITDEKAQFILGPYGSAATATDAIVAEKNGIPMVEANGAAQSSSS